MEEIGERMKLLIKRLGLPTTAKFCRDTGLSRPLVDKLTSGGNQPRFDTLQKIKSAFPKTNLNWLVSGQGEILEEVTDKKDVDLLKTYRSIKIKNNYILTNSFLTSTKSISEDMPKKFNAVVAFAGDPYPISFLPFDFNSLIFFLTFFWIV